MSKLFLLLFLTTIGINFYTIKINQQRIQNSYENINPLKKDYNRRYKMSYQMDELKKEQRAVSEKISNCMKDKSCYADKSYKELLFSLKLKAQTILAFYDDSCPEFKKEMNDFVDYIKTIDDLASFETNPRTLKELFIPELLELKTNMFIDQSFVSCTSEYASISR